MGRKCWLGWGGSLYHNKNWPTLLASITKVSKVKGFLCYVRIQIMIDEDNDLNRKRTLRNLAISCFKK